MTRKLPSPRVVHTIRMTPETLERLQALVLARRSLDPRASQPQVIEALIHQAWQVLSVAQESETRKTPE